MWSGEVLLRELRAHQFAQLHRQPVLDAVIHALAVFIAPEDPGRREQRQMLGDVGLRGAGGRRRPALSLSGWQDG